MKTFQHRFSLFVFFLVTLFSVPSQLTEAQQSRPAPDWRLNHPLLEAYFRTTVDQIAGHCLEDIHSLEDWTSRREEFRRQLLEMLGLWPLPPRTDLKPLVTGQLEAEEFTVEKLYFQSMPGLYVTANLYRPKNVQERLPAVLYVCGHGNIKKDNVSYGSKTQYRHHPAWFARHGYVSMVIDTLQLGEIEGIHHGTNRLGMWWWIGRGYTPAGVETWNAMRALDYLQSRPEVDPERIGVTGRSGGGAYSWYLAAADERIKAVVPVAGITDLQDHVVDGAIEGHCDCMFMTNTYGWDFPLLAALVAPRPLLLANSDKDRIFPLDGVQRIHAKVKRIYDLYGAQDRLGLLITEGPHSDTQDLQLPAFRWMNRWLKQQDPVIEKAALKFFEPEQLKVFDKLPEDERNTRIHETFVPAASTPEVPADTQQWQRLRQHWLDQLLQKSFAGWPRESIPTHLTKLRESTARGIHLAAYEFDSEETLPLLLWTMRSADVARPQKVILRVVDEEEWNSWQAEAISASGNYSQQTSSTAKEIPTAPAKSPADSDRFHELRTRLAAEKAMMVTLPPRGVGPTSWNPDKDVHIRRRFALIGQTLDGMRIWDVRRAVVAVQELPELAGATLHLEGRGSMAGIVLYASLFESGIARVELWDLPSSHREGPILLNVQKFMDLPQALGVALENTRLVLHGTDPESWKWPRSLVENLKLEPSQLVFAP